MTSSTKQPSHKTSGWSELCQRDKYRVSQIHHQDQKWSELKTKLDVENIFVGSEVTSKNGISVEGKRMIVLTNRCFQL